METINSSADWSSYFVATLLRFRPSRILNRLRSLDNPWGDLTEESSENLGYRSTTAETNSRLHRRMRDTVAMPGPLGFASSGYFLGVIFMAFLLNRVQNIVVPSRHVTSYDRLRARHALRQQLAAHRATARRSSLRTLFIYMRIISQSMFPVDLSSTRARLAFRVPSVYLLLRALLLWILILLQAAQFYPANSSYTWINALGRWAGDRSMDDICWFSFLSASFALFIGSLTNGLEGINSTTHAPFNLFGYAFILYIYSSPVTHTQKDTGGASRPDIHVLITMVMPLLQLTMTHILEANKRYARARFVPTTITSVLSLVHFHLVTFHSYFASSRLSRFATHSYPLPTLVPSLVETFLIFTILTTILLNALTQLLTTGTVRGPLFGMLGHAGSLAPRWDEDFGVVLFRLGTASLEATSVKGLGNEVGSIGAGQADLTASRSRASQSRRALAVKAQADAEREGGLLELNRSGVVTVYSARASAEGARMGISKGRGSKKGFWNEIKHVRASTRQTEVWADSLINVPWYRGLGRFVLQLWILMTSIWEVVRRWVTGRTVDDDSDDEDESEDEVIVGDRARSRERSLGMNAETDVYEKFLRGDDLGEEDDDGEFDPDSQVFDQHLSDSDLQDGSDDEDDDDDNIVAVTSDTLSLYADLCKNNSTSGSTASAPLLLAHLTSQSPLTRRKYSSMLQATPQRPTQASGVHVGADSYEAYLLERRAAKTQGTRRGEDEAMSESRRNCVICTAEPRQIICWPCRCLALCDDCRENLASRSAASKHMCPCCRRNVEGFSKIYIP